MCDFRVTKWEASMNNVYASLSVGFGGILFLMLMSAFLVFFRNIKKRMLPGHGYQGTAYLPESYWEEKRQHTRVGTVLPVSMENSQGIIRAKTRDVSLGGAFIVCRDPLALKEQFRLTIDFPDQKPLIFNSEVVWSNCNVPDDKIVTRGMGIRFIQVTEKERESLATTISAYLEERKET